MLRCDIFQAPPALLSFIIRSALFEKRCDSLAMIGRSGRNLLYAAFVVERAFEGRGHGAPENALRESQGFGWTLGKIRSDLQCARYQFGVRVNLRDQTIPQGCWGVDELIGQRHFEGAAVADQLRQMKGYRGIRREADTNEGCSELGAFRAVAKVARAGDAESCPGCGSIDCCNHRNLEILQALHDAVVTPD